jgi:hypothetical protein
MPTIPLYYSVVDSTGNIVLSQITTNSNYPVGEGQRLLVDQTPEYDSLTQYIVRITPVPADQDYVEYRIDDVVYSYEDSIDDVTAKRKFLFLNSDWTQLPDVQLTPSQVGAWRVYRQGLRDITNQPGYPINVIWPVIPE